MHLANSSDAGELHHHAMLRGTPRHVAPPPGREAVRERFGPPAPTFSARSGRSAGGVWIQAGAHERTSHTARSYGAVIAQLGAALSEATT